MEHTAPAGNGTLDFEQRRGHRHSRKRNLLPPLSEEHASLRYSMSFQGDEIAALHRLSAFYGTAYVSRLVRKIILAHAAVVDAMPTSSPTVRSVTTVRRYQATAVKHGTEAPQATPSVQPAVTVESRKITVDGVTYTIGELREAARHIDTQRYRAARAQAPHEPPAQTPPVRQKRTPVAAPKLPWWKRMLLSITDY